MKGIDQMKKNKISVCFCCFILCAVFVISAYATPEPDAYGWYVIRNSEHKQPQLEPHMSFIESHGAYYIDRAHGDDCDDKVVYLTFDAGYENGNVSKILDTLKAEGVHGAFFVLNNLITNANELVKRMIDEGHTVCNHSVRHKDMSTLTKEEFTAELLELEEIYSEHIGGELSKYFRPPEGRFTEENLDWAHALGYNTIFWSFAYADWDNNKQPSIEAAKEKILSNVHNGAIILLHPTSATNAEILKSVIGELKAQGYRFGTLDELCGKAAG